MHKRALLIVVASLLLGLTAMGQGPEPWHEVYRQAERAFNDQKYEEAEQLFLKSMRFRESPVDRGVDVLRTSQTRGVIPEYFLAIIGDRLGQLDKAYNWAANTRNIKGYFRADDARQKEMSAIIEKWNAANPPTTERGIRVGAPSPITPDVVGPFHALVIGIDDYRYQPKLMTAVADAKAVAAVLEAEYGFQVKLLINATRTEIRRAFNEYKTALTGNDNLVIYYAGHGQILPRSERVFWLPIDANVAPDTSEWIGSEDTTGDIKEMYARHVLLISDSCYAGGLSRTAAPADEAKRDHANYIRKMIHAPSRSLLGSGGLQPVADGGGGGHSVFAAALLNQLRKERDDAAFTATDLFRDLRLTVAGRSAQVPVYQQINNASLALGDVGDFVFLRQRSPGKTPIH